MLVICSKCSTSYTLDPATVGAAGRTVRCARCHETWFVNPPDPVDAFVDGVMAEAEAEVAQQRRELATAEALSSGVPVYPRDLDVTAQVEAPQIEATAIDHVDSPPLIPEQETRGRLIMSLEGRGRRMPPPKSAQPSVDEVNTVREWIKAGAQNDGK